MPPQSKKEPRVPAYVRDELRRVIAVQNLSTVYDKKGMKHSEQQDYLEATYHGRRDKGIISHVDMLCRAQGSYASLYEPFTDAQGAEQRVLSSFLCQSENQYYAGIHVNVKCLERTSFDSEALVTGRYLHDQGVLALKLCRKAHTKLLRWLNEDGTPKGTGSRTKEDYANLMLDAMYRDLQGKKSVTKEDPAALSEEGETDQRDSGDEESLPDSGRPKGWIFNGFFVFMKCGLLGEPEERLKFFTNDDPPAYSRAVKKTADRQHDRNLEKEEERGQRQLPLGSGRKRMTLDQQIRLAALEIQVSKHQSDLNEVELFALNAELQALMKLHERSCQLASFFNDMDAFNRAKELEAEIDEVRKAIRACRTGKKSLKRCAELIDLATEEPSESPQPSKKSSSATAALSATLV